MTATTIRTQGNGIRKALRRLMPFLAFLYFVANIDRIAIAHAAPHGMTHDLGITATQLGLAAGFFFITYTLLEIPANVALTRLGPRVWLTAIILAWGVVQTASAFVPNVEAMYMARLLVGAAEAGFVPGVIFYMLRWFPRSVMAWALSIFYIMPFVTNAVAAPLFTLTKDIGELLPIDMTPWRFLILVSGILGVAAGIATWVYLRNDPEEVAWLTPDESAELKSAVAREESNVESAGGDHSGVFSALKDRRVLLLGLAFFPSTFCSFSLIFFLPTIISTFRDSNGDELSDGLQTLLNAFPWTLGIVGGLLISRYATKINSPGLGTVIGCTFGVLGSVIAVTSTNPYVLIVALAIAAFGLAAIAPTIFAVAPKLFVGASGAAAIALINSIGGSGGFFGPYLTGFVTDHFGSQRIVYGLMVVGFAICGLLTFLIDCSANRSIEAREAREAPHDAEQLRVRGRTDGSRSGWTSVK